jgi:nucleotide-binding universal stress UspA family protein
MTEPVIVATDGSRGATAAVEWAADDAARKGLPLRVVHAVDRLPYDISRYPIPSMQNFMTRSGQSWYGPDSWRSIRDRGRHRRFG